MLKVKTMKQLEEEGWKRDYVRTNGTGATLDLGKGAKREARVRLRLEHFVCTRVLGKKVTVIDTRMHGNPEILIQVDDYKTWLPWQVFASKIDTSAPKKAPKPPGVKYKKIGGEECAHFLEAKRFKLHYSLDKMNHKTALQLTKWLAKEMGYQLVPREKK